MPEQRLTDLLGRPPSEWRASLDERYRVLDEVLSGRRAAVIYPAARIARYAASRLLDMGVRVVAFGDRDPALHAAPIDGLPVLSPDEIAAHHRRDAILVASTLFDSIIAEDFRSRGCEGVVPVGYLNLRLPEIFRSREYHGAWSAATNPDNRAAIERAFALLADAESRRVFIAKLTFYLSLDKRYLDAIRSSDTIYFDRSVYDLGSDEVVVDGGAYNGDTLRSFQSASQDRFHSYIAFEPDADNFASLAALAAPDPRVRTVRAGLGRRASHARLLSTHLADARLLGDEESGGDDIALVSLDEYFENRRAPSLIKMDIEGSEADALLGGNQLIRDAEPTLAVSAYHYPPDLWSLPLLIEQLIPSARLFLRHYTREIDDTVCYAVPNSRTARLS